MFRNKSRFDYRAGAAVHGCLVELLAHSEVDVSGADCGGRFDGQRLSVLRDLHQRLRGGFHCNLTQHHIHPWNTKVQQRKPEKSAERKWESL